jgi:hypothetical protein
MMTKNNNEELPNLYSSTNISKMIEVGEVGG